jgi:hypothetical protein
MQIEPNFRCQADAVGEIDSDAQNGLELMDGLMRFAIPSWCWLPTGTSAQDGEMWFVR